MSTIKQCSEKEQLEIQIRQLKIQIESLTEDINQLERKKEELRKIHDSNWKDLQDYFTELQNLQKIINNCRRQGEKA